MPTANTDNAQFSARTAFVDGAACLLLLLVAYRPVYLESFVFNDDSFMLEEAGEPCADHPQFHYFFKVGRPLYPLLACPAWAYANDLRALAVVRLASVCTLAVAAALFCRVLRTASVPRPVAIAASVASFTLPSWEVVLVQANALPHMFAASFGVGAGAMLVAHHRGRIRLRHAVVVSFVLMVAAACVHPALALLSPAPGIAVIAGTPGWSRARTRFVAIQATVVAASLATFLVLSRWIAGRDTAPLPEEFMVDHSLRMTLDTERFFHLFRAVGWAVADAWSVEHTGIPGTLLGLGAAATALLLPALRVARGEPPRRVAALVQAFVTVSYAAVTIAPLLGVIGTPSYRQFPGTSAIFVACVLFLYLEAARYAPPARAPRYVTATAIAVLGIALTVPARDMTQLLIRPAQIEREVVADAVAELPRGTSVDIVIKSVRPLNAWFVLVPVPVGMDEFGFLTTSLPQNTRGFVRSVLREQGWSEDQLRSVSTHWTWDPAARSSPGVVVVDMSRAMDRYWAAGGVARQRGGWAYRELLQRRIRGVP